MDTAQKSENAQREEETLAFWNERDVFKKSLDKDAPRGRYTFYDGPPFATGLPHYGHIVASVIKDAIPRYFTMRGFHVPRVWGWDCHGLPIENIVEKELGFKHKKDIIKMGVAKFNEMCRQRVLTYVHEWEKIIPRIGRWADMEHAYLTMQKSYMESVWWVFKQLWDKELVYRDYRVMHICPRCETTLSQQEVSEGYSDVKDIAVTVKFRLVDPEKIGLSGNVSLLAWTTTPWTLPGNVALAVGQAIEYVVLSKKSELDEGENGSVELPIVRYIVARAALPRVMKDRTDFTLEKHVLTGKDLVGLSYEPPLDYYEQNEKLEHRENGWKVYAADFVTADEGTGIAHEAPAFGADDWELLKKYDLPFVQHVNPDGTFKAEVTDFAGMEVKPRSDDDKVRLGTDIAVIKYLQDHGTFFAKENIVHSYPHCWRCDTPLLSYATSSWFIAVTKMKHDLMEYAKDISWSPVHVKEGRWGKWLEGARDWSISRQRFWASVLPIWICEKCGATRVFGSAAELEEASGAKVDDLHKHIVDEITFPCAQCADKSVVMRRVPDVLDTWFDSGSMPYAERHYPFEHKDEFKREFPAQFIAEGVDQTRAWFYYLHVLAGAIFERNGFENVIVNGIVLAEDGKKMSKRLNNYPDPMLVVDRYGADALRYYLLSSSVVAAENLNFSEQGVAEVARKNIGRLVNVLAFYLLYADSTPRDFKSEHVLDRWILARLAALVAESTEGYEHYELDVATRPLTLFIDDLSAWYIRRSRDRFKSAADTGAPPHPAADAVSLASESDDKKSALATLRYVLHTLARVMAPSMPFLAEHLFQAVREDEDEESVHLASWPDVPELGFAAPAVLAHMFLARTIVTQALEAREAAKIKVRQPLAELTIPANAELPEEYVALIADEVNVETVIREGDTLKLDTKITDSLREQGIVRDTIREIQTYRKEQNLKPGERTVYAYAGGNRAVVEKNKATIEGATNTAIQFD